MNIDGGDEVRLTEQPASSPRFSPDGKYIACVYEAAGEPQRIAVLSIDGGTPIKLFDVPSSSNFSLGLRWTRDAKAVTYRDWVYGVWRQELSGGGPTRVAGLPREKIYGYDWSHDGKEFAFTYGSYISDVVLITLDPNSSQ